jgi:hypothetical protein
MNSGSKCYVLLFVLVVVLIEQNCIYEARLRAKGYATGTSQIRQLSSYVIKNWTIYE